MNHQIKINVKFFHVFKKYNKPMNGSELRIQLWTLHVAEAGRTWPFLIRIPSQFKAFQVLINCFYGFGFWTFWISSFGFWIRTSCARRMRQRKSNTAGGWLWVLVLNWSPTETIEKKIPAESWVSWPNSTNPKIERRLTNVQGPSQCVSVPRTRN